jgi:hypothetical protein
MAVGAYAGGIFLKAVPLPDLAKAELLWATSCYTARSSRPRC